MDVRKPLLRVWESSGTFEALRVRRLRNELSSKLCILRALLLVMLLCNFRPLFYPSLRSLSLSCYLNFPCWSLFFSLIGTFRYRLAFSLCFCDVSDPLLSRPFELKTEARERFSFFIQASLRLKYLSQRCPAELEQCPPAGAESSKVSSPVLWRVIKMDIALPRRPDAEIAG